MLCIEPGSELEMFTVISIAILFYDYFLTLGREVDYIWKKKLSFVSILFYCYRYAAILSWPAIFFVTRPPLSWASHSLVSSIAYVTFRFIGCSFLLNNRGEYSPIEAHLQDQWHHRCNVALGFAAALNLIIMVSSNGEFVLKVAPLSPSNAEPQYFPPCGYMLYVIARNWSCSGCSF